MSLTDGTSTLSGIYERLRKRSYRSVRAMVRQGSGFLFIDPMDKVDQARIEHAAYVRGVRDALNEVS